MVGAGSSNTRPGRHHQREAWRHRASRCATSGRRSSEDRSILSHRRVSPRHQRSRRRDLLRVDLQARRDRSHRDRHWGPHLLRQGCASRRQHKQRWPLPEGLFCFPDQFLSRGSSLYSQRFGKKFKVLTAIGNFCICSIAVGMLIEIVVMYPVQHRRYRDGIDNLLVLLIGGIPIAMPTVLSVTMAIGSHRLSQQGAITKRMTAIEEMAGMDVLCSDKTGTLTLNKLTVDKSMIEVFISLPHS